VARLVHVLEAEAARLPFVELHEIRVRLGLALRGAATISVLNSMKSGAFNCSVGAAGSEDLACWSSFLGQADATGGTNSTPTPHGDDTFFTTATALNMLTHTWLTPVSASPVQLRWRADAPTAVVSAVAGAANFLTSFYAINPPEYALMGAFFSGSVKNRSSSPWSYPSNVVHLATNATDFSCADKWIGDQFSFDQVEAMIFAVRGLMPDSEFDSVYASGSCAGMSQGTLGEEGLNDPQAPWPFWSSTALTLSFAMNALAKVAAIVQ
jgi:hypothetical protein